MKKGLIFFLFCLICEEVFAGVFTVIPTDQSQKYLGMVFGGSVGAISLGGGDNPTLSLMFERFNFIIVTIGAVVLAYVGVMTTINTAREGEAMGKKISLWVPLRAFSGMLLMVPGPTTGYSVVQMTVMWIVLNGVGAANAVWNVVLGQLAQNVSAVGGLTLELTPSSLNNVTQSVLQSSACMYAINSYMPELSANAGPLQNQNVSVYTVVNAPTPAPSGTQPSTITQTSNVYVGVQGAAFPIDRLCGIYTVTTSLSQGSTTSTFNYATVQQRLAIKTAGLLAMFSAIDPAAQLLANPSGTYTTPDPGYVNASGQAYISQISQLATGVSAAPGSNAQSWEAGTAPVNPITGDYTTLKSYGWIHAGSYYFTMVKATGAAMDPETTASATLPSGGTIPTQTNLISNALSPAGSLWPTNNQGTSALGNILASSAPYFEVLKMNTALQHAYSYWTTDQLTPPPPTQGIAVTTTSTGNDVLDIIVNGIKDKIQTPILNYIQSITAGTASGIGTQSGDPLVSLGEFGGILMLAAELMTFVSIVASFIASLAVSSVSCLNPLPWAVNVIFLQIIPLIYGIAIILWTLGATIGIYLPLVPYIVFTMTAFGWIIQVIEAVVAAPIIALGLVHPSGGEELGKIGAALPILANVFLRPTLMIFGFVLGASLLRAGIAFVNFGFIPAIQEGAATSIFSILAVLGMYVGIMTALINKSFSLIYLLPNQIMRWMGGQAEGGGPEEMVKEAKGGFDKGAESAQKGLSQSASGANEQASKKWDEKNADIKEGRGGKKKGGGGGGMPPAAPAGP